MDEEEERRGDDDARHRGLGKWARAGVPKKGWEAVDWFDLEEPIGTCEMCETSTIRFVHVMRHADYHEDLDCGCVCAEHMQEDYVNPRKREKALRNRAGRRARFAERKGWKLSANGTPYIKVDGHHMVVAKRKGGFGVGITPPGSDKCTWGKKTYTTLEAAKRGCFDALEYTQQKGG